MPYVAIRKNVLDTSRLKTFASILDLDEADVEDIFDQALYLEIVNKAYDLPDEHKLSLEKLDQNGGSQTRLVKKVEACFKLLPAEIPEFDHFTPSEWLFRNASLLDETTDSISSTLDRA